MADYSAQWADYRRVRNVALAVLFGLIPLMVAVRAVFRLFESERLGEYGSAVVLLCWLLTALYTGGKLTAWRCPRCGEPYGFRWWYKGTALLKRKCAHCGLEKFANA